MTESLSNAIAALIVALIPIVALYLRSYVKTKLTPSRLADLQAVARVSVIGVEKQLGSGEGPAKLALATEAVRDAAKHFGLNISDDLATALIHAALDEVERANSYNDQVLGEAINNAYQTGLTDALAGTAEGK